MKINKRFISVIAIIGFSIISNAQVPNYVPSNGLVGWWPFNGNTNDESGNGNNGTVNGATLTNDRFGNVGQAYGFDGNDFITIPDNAVLNSDYISVSIWFQTVSTSFGSLIYKTDPSAINEQYGLVLNYPSINNIIWSVKNGNNCSSPGSGWQTTNVNYNSSDGVWHQIVCTYDGSLSAIYLDNMLVTSSAFSVNIISACGGEINIGKGYNSSYLITGKIDDIGIWDRALTQCEIQDLYHSQLGSQAISAGLDQSICAGDNVTLNASGGNSYQWDNNVLDGLPFGPTQTATYSVNGTDSLGCTGSDTVVVSVLENEASSLTQTALDSYTLNGQTYTQSGTYTQVVPAANGCDSTITLNLTLNFTGINELVNSTKILVKITDLNGKIIQRRKNIVMLFIYEDGTVERVVEME